MAEDRVSDHAMSAEFGQSRALRQSSRAGCRDEFHGNRVAAALARAVAKENPNMLVKYTGGTNIEVATLDHASVRKGTRLDDLDPREARRRQAEAEYEMQKRERDMEKEREAQRIKAAEDEKRREEARANKASDSRISFDRAYPPFPHTR
jgi:hypothetical protein